MPRINCILSVALSLVCRMTVVRTFFPDFASHKKRMLMARGFLQYLGTVYEVYVVTRTRILMRTHSLGSNVSISTHRYPGVRTELLKIWPIATGYEPAVVAPHRIDRHHARVSHQARAAAADCAAAQTAPRTRAQQQTATRSKPVAPIERHRATSPQRSRRVPTAHPSRKQQSSTTASNRR